MKKTTGVFLVGTLLSAALLFYACEKSFKPDLTSLSKTETNGLKGTAANGLLSTALVADADTVHIKEADSIFQIAVNHGLKTALANRYALIKPIYSAAVMYFLENGLVSLYVPVAYDVETGRVLKMVVLKENNKYRRVIFEEKEPTAAWRATNTNYLQLTGTARFFNSHGVLVKQLALTGGLATGEIPIGGSSSAATTHIGKAGSTHLSGSGNDNDDDEDGDGVADENDKCPRTPVGTFVDSHGCPLTIDLDGVTITASDESGFFGFPPIYWPTPDPGPVELSTFPGDVEGGGTAGPGGPTTPPTPPSTAKRGDLCGTYAMKKVGDGVTGEFQIIKETFLNRSTGVNFTVGWNQMCVSIAPCPDPNLGSRFFVEAFNDAVLMTNVELDARRVSGDAVSIGNALDKFLRENLEAVAPKTTISTGPCLGADKPITEGKYHNPITGDCEKLPN